MEPLHIGPITNLKILNYVEVTGNLENKICPFLHFADTDENVLLTLLLLKIIKKSF